MKYALWDRRRPGGVFAIALTAGMAVVAVADAAEPTGASPNLSPKAVYEVIREAEAARRRAAEADAEWLNTANLIQQARQEADQGNWPQAAALAAQALQQGELAVAQAERESEAWQSRVVR